MDMNASHLFENKYHHHSGWLATIEPLKKMHPYLEFHSFRVPHILPIKEEWQLEFRGRCSVCSPLENITVVIERTFHSTRAVIGHYHVYSQLMTALVK